MELKIENGLLESGLLTIPLRAVSSVDVRVMKTTRVGAIVVMLIGLGMLSSSILQSAIVGILVGLAAVGYGAAVLLGKLDRYNLVVGTTGGEKVAYNTRSVSEVMRLRDFVRANLISAA